MALKFLNKKGWHTGSLRNIENVWKAEQKHEAEQKKLEELRKQIQDERDRFEFQQQTGLLPQQERLEFLYDSGLAVGKGGSSSSAAGVSFKPLEEAAPLPNNNAAPDAVSTSKETSVPGALFEDKPHSANDTWRKLHSDPLLLIRQREQEALARIKNNPVQMALIRKSVEGKTEKDKSIDKKERVKKQKSSSLKHHRHSSSKRSSSPKHHIHSSSKHQPNLEMVHDEGKERRESRNHKDSMYDDESSDRGHQRRMNDYRDSKYRAQSPRNFSHWKASRDNGKDTGRTNNEMLRSEKHSHDTDADERRKSKSYHEARPYDSSVRHDTYHKRRNVAPKLSEEEKAAKLREMQADAELHEQQRWKRLKRAEEDDVREAARAGRSGGKNFLDAAQRSIYGAEKGGSSTIEESVRRRTHYSQGRSELGESNAFRR